jgi:orotidine-5'-phosphate decarboxylase
LDFDTQGQAYSFAESLARSVKSGSYGFKVNLDAIANFGYETLSPRKFLEQVTGLGKPVFLDMKMWNGGRTMSNIARGCAQMGVDIVNMYPHAGGKFMQRVAESLEGSSTRLFGLTVLTHYTDEDTMRLYGKSLPDTVRMLAEISQESGAQGIIVPPTQLHVVRDIPLLKLSPGIRPEEYEDQKDNAQEQICTPEQAVEAGADYLVIGSPIRKARSPPEALERILASIK